MARTKQIARVSGQTNGTTAVTDPNIKGRAAKKFKEIADGPMQAELKHIDKKYTEKGVTYYAETKEDKDIPEQVNWWDMFALCLVRNMDRSNKYVQSTSLQINSQHLKDILKKVIVSFPGISFATKDITIAEPYRVLYHYRHELEAERENLEEDSDAAKHLELLVNFIYDQFEDVMAESENLREQSMMSYKHLWTIFRPGVTVYASLLGQPRAFELLSYSYGCSKCHPHVRSSRMC